MVYLQHLRLHTWSISAAHCPGIFGSLHGRYMVAHSPAVVDGCWLARFNLVPSIHAHIAIRNVLWYSKKPALESRECLG